MEYFIIFLVVCILLLLLFLAPNFKFNKIYLHSKSTGSGGPKTLALYFLIMMGMLYISAIGVLLILSLSSFFSSAYVLYLIPLFVAAFSGFYLASRKNFLFFSNEKLNSFPVRLFFLLPGAFTFSFLFMVFSALLVLVFTPYLDGLNTVSISILTALSLIGSLLTILLFKKSILKDDLPPEYQPDFMEHRWYVFMPAGGRINDSASYGILKEPRYHNIRHQANDLKINSKKYDQDILFTKFGALIISSKALQIFKKNSLTGYEIRNVLDKKAIQEPLYFQIVPTSKMPQMSPQTKIKKGPSLTFLEHGFLISDDIIYYDASAFTGASDFNTTSEYLGTNSGMPYFHQKFWIVSHKTMEILIGQLNQRKRDFIPVMIAGGERM